MASGRTDRELLQLFRGLAAAALERDVRPFDVHARIGKLSIEPLERDALVTYYNERRAEALAAPSENDVDEESENDVDEERIEHG